MRMNPSCFRRRGFQQQSDFEKVDCVILDINLNDGSGIELGHHLKAAALSVPVIYMTGNIDLAVQKAAWNWMHRISNKAVLQCRS